MFTYKDKSQIIFTVDSKVGTILEKIAKEGNFESVSLLMESIAFEIALDEGLLAQLKQLAKPKSNGKHRAVA